MDPEYLVLDEFTAHLDVKTRRDMRRMLISRCADKGLLVVSHFAADMLTAHRVVVINEGAVAWEGTPNELLVCEDVLSLCGFVDTQLLNVAVAMAQKNVDVESLDFDNARHIARALKDAGLTETFVGKAEQPRPISSPTIYNASGWLMLDNVHVTLGEVEVLRGMGLSAASGEVTLVVGSCGSGKTTSAFVAAGAIRCDAGMALLDEKAVRLGDVGLCMQQPEDQLFCSTVLDDVAYGHVCAGKTEEEARQQAKATLEAVGVAKKLWEKQPFELSGGERRLIALAGILTMNQPAIVLDEPTAGMDGDGASKIRKLVRRVADEGRAVVVVSHDVDEWLDISDKLIIVEGGRPRYVGSVVDVSTNVDAFTSSMEGAPFSVALRAELAKPGSASAPRVTKPLPATRYARNGVLFRIPAAVKVLFLIIATVLLFSMNSLEIMVACLFGAALLCMGAHARMGSLLRLVRNISIVLIMSLLANSLVLDGTGDVPLFANVALSSTGMLRGTFAVVRIVTISWLALAVASCTKWSDIASALLAPLAAFDRLGINTSGVRTAVTLALHEVPQTIKLFRQIEMAQRARGAHIGEGPLHQRLESWLAVLVPMIVALMRNADDLGDALVVRGFGR